MFVVDLIIGEIRLRQLNGFLQLDICLGSNNGPNKIGPVIIILKYF